MRSFHENSFIIQILL